MTIPHSASDGQDLTLFTEPDPEPDPAPAPEMVATVPRPGSRAARMSNPTMTAAIREIAVNNGVCVRPQALRRTNLATGETTVIDLRCGSTREKVCPPCAQKAKRLRIVQAREGWHRSDEPTPPATTSHDQEGLLRLRANYEYARNQSLQLGEWNQVADLDEAIREVEALITVAGLRGAITPSGGDGDGDQGDGEEKAPPKRKRSTRRRQDVPDLPRRRMTAKTVGRTFVAVKDGKEFRPSTFLTLTLDSYGRVRDDGSPVNPATYDYRRAAWDAVHFPALLDRFWQNLRRAEGWNVQYFGSIEPQRRLAPHAHFAIRGTMPHAMLRKVVAATYHQVWWPPTDRIVYPDHAPQPVWNADTKSYCDPQTGAALPTWADAMADLDDELDTDPDREPEHVIRFGVQVKPVGVLAGTPEAERLIGYIAKYIVKSVADCHTPETPSAEAHQRRLWEELRYTPCSERCPNWLRYGVQPAKAKAKQRAGHCKAKVHQLDTLGIGGRRVLVSRDWTGKTLADHRYDQLAWVKQTLRRGLVATGAAESPELADETEKARNGEAPDPVAWEMARPDDPDVPPLNKRLLRAIATRIQHREAIQAAQAVGPPGEGADVSATATAAGVADG